MKYLGLLAMLLSLGLFSFGCGPKAEDAGNGPVVVEEIEEEVTEPGDPAPDAKPDEPGN